MSQERVKQIDPGMNYVCRLKPSATCVYKVQRNGNSNGDFYVLKATRNYSPDMIEWDIEHIKKETEILTLGKDIPGITHLVKDYGEFGDFQRAILKEYFEGDNLQKVNIPIKDKGLKRFLRENVLAIHSLGYAGLELERKNIVISPDKKDIRIVDIGYGKFRHNIGDLEFELRKKEDFKDLKKLSR